MQRIIGESSTLSHTLAHVSRVAPVNRPILIVGERGCGKELIAERLHFLSKRWGESFDKLNCAAISEPLLDSELFGHEAGAFTGANKLRLGRFERADGGTLFLDELGAMPLRIQEKLLRLIEYGEYERLGGQSTLTVDVRIVAATNADLPTMVTAGTFRADLLDRLAFDVVNVPPLRDRADDIPALADYFGLRMSQELGSETYPSFSNHALADLRRHSWPGNIRELKNTVERSVCHWSDHKGPIDRVILNPFTNTSETNIKRGNASFEPVAEDIARHAPHNNDPAPVTNDSNQVNFSERVKALELKLLTEALTATGHHQGNAATSLGLTYHQFRALLRKYKYDLLPNQTPPQTK